MQSFRLAALLLAASVPLQTQAQPVSVEGYFIALTACEATKKKDRDNPGNVRLLVRHAYDVIARNATPGSHYQIKVPDAPVTQARWVSMDCGILAPAASLVLGADGIPGMNEPNSPVESGGLTPDSIEFVLAASWQPGFCATDAGQDKPECRSLTRERFDASHFSLHGLWPDDLDDTAIFPCYCDRGAPINCASNQADDTSIDLSSEVLDRLAVAMPSVQSGLHLHEWPKHGACYENDKTGADAGADPDEYFTESMAVLDALNLSAVRELFVANLDAILTRSQIEDAFDQAFGRGAGERVQIVCAKIVGENIITELRIALKGDITEPSDLVKLIQAAPPVSDSVNSQGCSSGRILRAPR